MAHSFNKWIIKEYQTYKNGIKPEVEYDSVEPEILILKFFQNFNLF